MQKVSEEEKQRHWKEARQRASCERRRFGRENLKHFIYLYFIHAYTGIYF